MRKTGSSRTGALHRAWMLIVLVGVALVVAGCGGDGDGTGTTASSGPVGEGTKDSPATVTTSSDQDTGTDTDDEGDTQTVSGSSVFASNCSVCHGFQGTGGNGGPSIVSVSDKELAMETVREGRGAMPAFGDQLSDEEIEAVAEHVVSLEP